MPRKVETEFAFDIGDVVRLKAWNYTQGDRTWNLLGESYAPKTPSGVFQIVELTHQIGEGGLQRSYVARPNSAAGQCGNYMVLRESELELAERLPQEPVKPARDATNESIKAVVRKFDADELVKMQLRSETPADYIHVEDTR
jgi:hypothetical protein